MWESVSVCAYMHAPLPSLCVWVYKLAHESRCVCVCVCVCACVCVRVCVYACMSVHTSADTYEGMIQCHCECQWLLYLCIHVSSIQIHLATIVMHHVTQLPEQGTTKPQHSRTHGKTTLMRIIFFLKELVFSDTFYARPVFLLLQNKKKSNQRI